MSQVLNEGPLWHATSPLQVLPRAGSPANLCTELALPTQPRTDKRSPCRGWCLEDKALHSPLPQSLGGAPCRFPEPSAPDSGVWGGAQKSAILEHSWGYILTAARLGNWPEEYAEMILKCLETGLSSCRCVLLLIIKAAQGCLVHKESKIQNEPSRCWNTSSLEERSFAYIPRRNENQHHLVP